MKKIVLLLISLLFFTTSYILPVQASSIFGITSRAFRADFNNGEENSFGYFSNYYNTATRYAYSWNLDSTVENGYMNLSANYSLFEQNGTCPSNHYSYIRKEVFSGRTMFGSQDGFSMKINLKLNMTPLKSLSESEGLGRTGFVLNVRDSINSSTDNEFYLSICAYQTGTVITATGGNRNQLSSQEVSRHYFANLDPNQYHEYLFVYDPNYKITVYIDGERRCKFDLSCVGSRTDTTGYYDSDFVAFSLVNRSLNAHKDEATGRYIASSSASIDYIVIYNSGRQLNTLYGQDLGNDLKTKIALSNVKRLLTDMGEENYINYYPKASMEKFDFVQLIEDSKIFVFVGHGGKVLDPDLSLLQVNPNARTEVDKYISSREISEHYFDMSDTELVMLVGCNTGHGTTTTDSLVEALKSKGVDYVLAFTKSIDNEDANYFVQLFFNELKKGASYQEARLKALYNTDGSLRSEYLESSIESCEIM